MEEHERVGLARREGRNPAKELTAWQMKHGEMPARRRRKTRAGERWRMTTADADDEEEEEEDDDEDDEEENAEDDDAEDDDDDEVVEEMKMEDMEELEEMDDGLDDDERFLDRLRDNAYARDFTLNGLLYDVQSGELYDFVNGIDDIRNQVVRSITPANEAFQEDPARMVRAIRVAARHDFRPAPDLVSAIRANARLVRAEPPARMAAELLTVLSCGYAARAVRVLWECGLLEHLMREHASYIARAVGDPTKSLVVAGAARGGGAEDATNDVSSSMQLQRATDVLFERDPLFRVLAALDARHSPSSPASEAMVCACLAAPLAIAARSPHTGPHTTPFAW
jgi:tRNA nucleotidyltransferase/poly(A) polymerase